jgi:hypothetical protein
MNYETPLNVPTGRIRLYVGRGRFALEMLVLIGVLGTLTSCSSLPAAPHALLDEHTGVTTTVVGAPISFARVRIDVTGSAREYLTLVAVERDVSGHYTDLLLLYRWTVIIRGDAPPSEPDVGPVKIQADEHMIDLQPLSPLPLDLSQREPLLFMPIDNGVAVAEYAVNFNTLRWIASSRDLSVNLPQQPFATPFSLWRDGRPALAQFVTQLNGS